MSYRLCRAWALSLAVVGAGGCANVPIESTEAPLVSHWGHTLSFTFDDGYATDTLARTMLGDLPATSYVITSQIGTPGRLTWAQVADLNASGWEIGSHSLTHQNLDSLTTVGASPPNCAATTPTLVQELYCSRADLIAHNLHPSGVAFPFGAYNAEAMRLAGEYYYYARGFYDPIAYDPLAYSFNTLPLNRHDIQVIRVHWCDTLEQVEARICGGFYGGPCQPSPPPGHRAVVLVFHRTFLWPLSNSGDRGTPSCSCANEDERYDWPAPDLAFLSDWVSSTLVPQTVEVATLRDVFGFDAPGTPPLVPRGTEVNPSAQMNLSGSSIHPYLAGTSSSVSRAYNSGVASSPATSLRLNAAAATRYFRSALLPVSAGTHIAEVSLNVRNMASAEAIGLYVDEYNSAGTWISGISIAETCIGGTGCQGAAQSIRTLNGLYTPSSSAVTHVRLQVYIDAGSGWLAVDNLSLRQL